MKQIEVKKIIKPMAASDGAGVKLKRSIGTHLIDYHDPFLMLDEFGSENKDDYIGGFPAHPHRGIETVTYMLSGEFEHEDSTGAKGRMSAGDVQWMKTGGGIIHSEMPAMTEGKLHGFQLWINMPAKYKMNKPEYIYIDAEQMQVYKDNDKKIKVIAGKFKDAEGPVKDHNVEPVYFDVELEKNKEFNFAEVFIKGLADDGGLYVPKSLKKYSTEELLELKNLNYNELSTEIINLFSADFISRKELSSLIKKSYSTFREKDVVKISSLRELKLLELFHGPTLAFKDIAMQFIGNLYEYYLSKNDKKINIIVATSGDTGAAAIDAIKGKSNLNIFVLHPNNRISPVQRKIMTTVEEKNVFNIAIDGNFDDCQNIVKQMFSDLEFSKSINMSGVNSINWARIIAQAVYYFYSYFKLGKETISFSVPTGNFGDVFAGYLAKKMGLPIDKLIVATNENDILHRAISKGDYVSKEVKETLSPSMDIQLASNFERLIYYINNSDSEKTADIMKKIKQNSYQIEKNNLAMIQKDFLSESCNEKETLDIIKKNYEENNIILDPHTAVGVGAAKKLSFNDCVVLSTAHPCKFPDATNNAINKHEKLPEELQHVLDKKENFQVLKNNTEEVKNFVKSKV